MLLEGYVLTQHFKALFSLTFDFWSLAVTWARHCVTWGYFPDQITFRSFKIWASPSIRAIQQALLNYSYKGQSRFIWDAIFGPTLCQHVEKDAGNLLFHPKKCPKNKKPGNIFETVCQHDTCRYMVWVLYLPLPSQLLVKESVAGAAFLSIGWWNPARLSQICG